MERIPGTALAGENRARHHRVELVAELNVFSTPLAAHQQGHLQLAADGKTDRRGVFVTAIYFAGVEDVHGRAAAAGGSAMRVFESKPGAGKVGADRAL